MLKVVQEESEPKKHTPAAVGGSPGEGHGSPKRHRLDLAGNRQVNSALHIVHVTQARMHEPAKSYLARRKNDGKTPREARRCHKRQLANVLIRHAPGKLVEGQTVTGWKAAFRSTGRRLPRTPDHPHHLKISGTH